MMRVRLKADGRIVEIMPDGSERTVDHRDPAEFVRQVRARCGLTQAVFAQRIEVPIETVRNWEQGKRSPRGPARALLKLIDSAPEAAFAALGGKARAG
jgi:putative transcriptional regulator